MPPMMMPPMILMMMLLIITFYANRKNKKSNMNTNTDDPNYDAPDSADNYASSPDYLIIYSSLKQKIDPISMLKLNKIK